MTADELRVAAEMVVATGTNKDWWDTIDAGALAVCRAWLAANPADSDEPITDQFLRVTGFDFDSKSGSYFAAIPPGGKRAAELCVNMVGGLLSIWVVNDQGEKLFLTETRHERFTRGRFRSFCLGLGLT